MSLNGLDDPKIKEAYDTASAEPGGWFLLKYVSRDEIELMGKGNGGIVEIRNTIAQEEEPAPLFGFLRYRRRNVLIKYIPAECSRLVQARVTVHFNAVTERFYPHDTIFPITTSKELRDTTLSAACSLHTASGSTSSSTSSLRRRRLMEIAEDEEEDTRAAKRQSTVPEERPATAIATPVVPGTTTVPSISTISAEQPSDLTSPPPPRAAIPTAALPSAALRTTHADFETSPPPPRAPAGSEILTNSPSRGDDDSRRSLSSSRPELYSVTSYSSIGKPKIKLGPRPSLDVGGRPHTSGASSHYRPVSSLPQGLKIFSRNSKKGEKDRPQTQYQPETPSMTISPPVPEGALAPTQELIRPHTSGGRPSTSSSAISKPLASPSFGSNPKMPLITPEKARLMKALELRKKQKQKSAAISLAPEVPGLLDLEDSLLATPATPTPATKDTASDLEKEEHRDAPATPEQVVKVEDSGIAFEARTDESDAARSDSYPVSPVGPSEGEKSTRASSVSGSTDETVQEGQATKTAGTPATDQKDSSPRISEPPVTSEAVEEQDDSNTNVCVVLDVIPTEPQPAETQEAVEAKPPAVNQDVPIVDGHVLDENKEDDSNQVERSPNNIALDSKQPQEPKEEIIAKSPPESPSKFKDWKVPRSKFSVQDLKAAATPPEVPDKPLPSPPRNLTVESAQKSPIGSTFSVETKKSHKEEGYEHGVVSTESKKRRSKLVEPIRTDIDLTDRSGHNSDANFSSDDDLMDELQSAVMQEAKPVQVSKSPISPVFPSPKRITTEPRKISRTFPPNQDEKKASPSPSNFLGLPKSGNTAPSRSVSASSAYLNRINQENAKPIAKKVNLGSGISQRIKALERLSALPPGAENIALSTGPPPGTSPAFFAVKKGSVRRTSRSPSIADRANSLSRNSPSPGPGPSRESSPETIKIRERSGSIRDRLDAFKLGPISTTQTSRSRPESISVTARIVRDPQQPFPAKSEVGKDPSDYTQLALKESPLVIDHQKAVVGPSKETLLERRQSRERRLSVESRTTTTTVKERRSSITVIKDLINDTRTSFNERRRSITLDPGISSPRRKSPSRPPSVHASPSHHRPMSISSRSSKEHVGASSPPHTAGSISSQSSEKGEKKSNRASRMIRRMSSSLSAGRKNIAHAMSPTVREEAEPVIDNRSLASSIPSITPITPTTIEIGDVNVQFPDTLLWKRRSMSFDSQGYLIMSPALTAHGSGKDKSNSGATRRFHLNEFRTPSIPDADMEELPNSVLLDFIEGGELQIACEDRAGQKRILHVLQETHHKWAAFGQ